MLFRRVPWMSRFLFWRGRREVIVIVFWVEVHMRVFCHIGQIGGVRVLLKWNQKAEEIVRWSVESRRGEFESYL